MDKTVDLDKLKLLPGEREILEAFYNDEPIPKSVRTRKYRFKDIFNEDVKK